MWYKKFSGASICAVLFGLSLNVYADDDSASSNSIHDWRKTGSSEEQLNALVKLTPGASHWMPEVAYRYQSMYWAAEKGMWDFAEYQIIEMDEMIKRVANARVKHVPLVKTFRDNVFPGLSQAAKTRDVETFRAAVAKTGVECVACHAKLGYGYIIVPPVPSKPNSIVLGYPE